MVWSQSAKLVGIALVRSNRTLGAGSHAHLFMDLGSIIFRVNSDPRVNSTFDFIV